MDSSLKDLILSICENHSDFFLSKANVIGIGLGTKIVNGIDTGELCIKVLVTKKVPIEDLKPEDVIPEIYLGVKTDVVEVGTLTPF
ncbi:MAG: hypothetical protein ACRC7R_06955 [Sarcina sp.]